MEVAEGEENRPPLADPNFPFLFQGPAVTLGAAFSEPLCPPWDPDMEAQHMCTQVTDLSREEWLLLFRQDPRFAASLSGRGLTIPPHFGGDHVLRAFQDLANVSQSIWHVQRLPDKVATYLSASETNMPFLQDHVLTHGQEAYHALYQAVESVASAY